jgi:hypothetical protein
MKSGQEAIQDARAETQSHWQIENGKDNPRSDQFLGSLYTCLASSVAFSRGTALHSHHRNLHNAGLTSKSQHHLILFAQVLSYGCIVFQKLIVRYHESTTLSQNQVKCDHKNLVQSHRPVLQIPLLGCEREHLAHLNGN